MSDTDSPDNPPPAASTGRQWLSLGLALHCICVGSALLWGLQPSPLQWRLKVVLSPYLTTLHLDPDPATFYWTQGVESDGGHHLEVLCSLPDSSAPQWRRVGQFVPGSPAHLRLQRAGRLLSVLVEVEAEEEVARMALDTVQWAEAKGWKPVRIRLRRQHLQERDDVRGAHEGRRNPLDPSYFETLYEADALRTGQGMRIVRRTAPTEAAPVARGATP